MNNIYLQYYRNKNGNEQLYALDQSIQTLYIIGDSENWKTKTKLVNYIIWNLVIIEIFFIYLKYKQLYNYVLISLKFN